MNLVENLTSTHANNLIVTKDQGVFYGEVIFLSTCFSSLAIEVNLAGI